MSPTQQFHAKQEQHDGGAYDRSPPLKIIHRLPPPPSSTGSSTNDAIPPTNKSHQPQSPPPPRRPVIIYTHSPKVIHTHPRDFMALVQKLTGYTPPPEDPQQQRVGPQRNGEDNESANSVVTEEHGTSVIGPPPPPPHVNSCFVDNNCINIVAPPHYNFNPSPPPPVPVFQTNSTDFLCTPSHHHHQLPFYNPDSMFMNRNSLSSSSSLRVLKEYPDM
uniref:VQ motif-containing protein 20-like n=1 Tax=Erigeron canadensis TaxID=72917 RepID=UPI001CB98107|nr:VQ motif-containing protein 20-like [Erigeron canadensis]